MRVLTVCVALLLATGFVYARTAGNGFINFDDPEYVSKNPVVQKGLTWQGVGWALRSTEQANWHPLTWWSHMLDVSLFGSKPGPQHLVSALLHAVSASALYLTLEGMTGAAWPSALVAAIFAVHPLHVESVAWIAERKDVLSGLFWMLCLLAYLRYVRQPGKGRYAAMAACLALSLMAKPMAVTLPVVLLLLDWWPLQRRRFREKLPLLALALLSGMATLIVQWRGGAMNSIANIPFGRRIENAVISTALYPVKLLWPQGLGVYYPYPAGSVLGWKLAVAGLFVSAVTLVAAKRRRQWPWLATGWAWYLVALAPVNGLIQVGAQARADRYTYLPSIGLTVVLAWGATAFARRSAVLRTALASGAAAALIALAVVAREQAGRWRDSETLFRHTLQVAGESTTIRTNLGSALIDLERWEDVLREYDPNDSVALFNVGIAYAKRRQWDEAEEAFKKVVGSNPKDREARFNLGMVATTLGHRETAEAQRAALEAIDKADAEKLGKFMALRGW